MDKETQDLIDRINSVIDNTTMADNVKNDAKKRLANGGDLIRELGRIPYTAYENIEAQIIDCASKAIIEITPTLKSAGIPGPTGRDLFKDIYKALGGQQETKYETK